MNLLCAIILTTFISMNGDVVEVAADSAEAVAYATETSTDIGDTSTYLSETETVSDGDVGGSDLSSGVVADYSDMIMLLEEQVELLSENSSSVTGSLNSSVLNLMDRMVDDYPSYYKYAGFRTSSDDTYTSTLYIAKKATVSGDTITFSDDCVAIDFYRTSDSNYSNYLYYTVSDAPGASVTISNRSIIYTNVLDGYPSLGTKAVMPEEYIWIGVFALLVLAIFLRRNKHD